MLPQPTDGFAWVQGPEGPALVCRALRPHADHLFTTRLWTLGFVQAPTDAEWQPVAAALGVDLDHFVRIRQVHGHAVAVHRAGAAGEPREADAIISADSSAALAIQAADCVPLLIADARLGAVAAAHAGWRGLAARLPSVTVEALVREFGSRREDLIAAVGPSISAARYEVGPDVRARFATAGFSAAHLRRWFLAGDRREHWYFDGWSSAREQLEAAGVPAAQVHAAGLCTASHPTVLCSYRRDGPGAGRIAGAIRAPHPSRR